MVHTTFREFSSPGTSAEGDKGLLHEVDSASVDRERDIIAA
jgi:hypothetical protein